jgi:hypothetical protein
MARAPQTPENLPAVQEGGAVALTEQDLALMSEGSKTGVDTFTIRQIVVPYLGLVQGSSDYVKPGTATFNRDIRVGQIIDSLMQVPMESALVIPCKYQDQWKEYAVYRDGRGQEKRGKLIRQWFTDDSKYKASQKRSADDGDGFPRYTQEGNLMIQEPTYYVMLVDEERWTARPCVLPMGSTQTKKSRRWNGLIDALRFSGPDGSFTAPIYAQAYRLTSVPEGKDDNTWSGWNIAIHGLTLQLKNGRDLWVQAQTIRKQVEEGVMKGQEGGDDAHEAPAAQASAPQGEEPPARNDDDIPF